MKGYKAVNQDGSANHGNVVYEAGGTYTCAGELEPCSNGIHFCAKCADVFNYYPRDSRVFEVEAVGEVVTDRDKSCTSELKVVRELSHAEVLDLCNSGDCNSGHRNSGDWNSGDCNSGDRNSGDCNSGDCNSGHRNSGDCNSGHRNSGVWNSGDCNSGDCNSGDWNSGDWNSGDWNSGDWNSGDWNSTNFSAGVLCTVEPDCLIFDEPSGMTLREWRQSEAARIMRRINVPSPTWRSWSELSEGERELNAKLECQGGMLITPKDCGKPDFRGWWDSLTGREKSAIMAIPNFDAAKWKLITGIEVEK